MRMWKPVLLLAATLAMLAACDTEKVDVMKSPCAGIDGSPCGPKRDVNGWWRHDGTAVAPDNV